MVSLELISTTCLAESNYRLLDAESSHSPVYDDNIQLVGHGRARGTGTPTGSWKKPLGITIIVVGSVVGGLFALYSLGTLPSECDENYDADSPELKECQKGSDEAMLGFFGGLALVGASIAGGVVLIKMSRQRSTVTKDHDLSLQWTYAF